MQAGGGVRDVDDAAALLDAGVARVVMGTAAVDDPALVADVAARRAGRRRARRPRRRGRRARLDRGERRARSPTRCGGFPAAAAFVVTQIGRDGLLGGPDLDGLAAAVAGDRPSPVIASGGVGTLDDLRGAGRASPGCTGVIVGRALYEGRFTRRRGRRRAGGGAS